MEVVIERSEVRAQLQCTRVKLTNVITLNKSQKMPKCELDSRRLGSVHILGKFVLYKMKDGSVSMYLPTK